MAPYAQDDTVTPLDEICEVCNRHANLLTPVEYHGEWKHVFMICQDCQEDTIEVCDMLEHKDETGRWPWDDTRL